MHYYVWFWQIRSHLTKIKQCVEWVLNHQPDPLRLDGCLHLLLSMISGFCRLVKINSMILKTQLSFQVSAVSTHASTTELSVWQRYRQMDRQPGMWLSILYCRFQQELTINNNRVSHQQLWNVIIIAIIVSYFWLIFAFEMVLL